MQTNVNSPSMETPASVNSGVYQTAPPGGFWENVTLQIRSTDRSCVSTEQTRRWGYVRVLYNSLWGQKSVSFLADRRDVCLISIQICSLFFFFLHGEIDTDNGWFLLKEIPEHRVCGAVQSDSSARCSSLSGLFTLSVRTMHVGRWRLSITMSCCLSDFSSSIWDFSPEFNTSNRSDS